MKYEIKLLGLSKIDNMAKYEVIKGKQSLGVGSYIYAGNLVFNHINNEDAFIGEPLESFEQMTGKSFKKYWRSFVKLPSIKG